MAELVTDFLFNWRGNRPPGKPRRNGRHAHLFTLPTCEQVLRRRRLRHLR